MDFRAELRAERDDLQRCDVRIKEGEARLARQDLIVARLNAAGHDVREAERLLDLMDQTLTQWRSHRLLALQRIAYLEERLAAG
jgi:uncharacterized coiled-coil protein SlyX